MDQTPEQPLASKIPADLKARMEERSQGIKKDSVRPESKERLTREAQIRRDEEMAKKM